MGSVNSEASYDTADDSSISRLDQALDWCGQGFTPEISMAEPEQWSPRPSLWITEEGVRPLCGMLAPQIDICMCPTRRTDVTIGGLMAAKDVSILEASLRGLVAWISSFCSWRPAMRL